MKRNYKMVVSYDGTRYFGWQHQSKTDMTIQGKLETVLTRLTKAEKPVQVIGAGRTDAGVHARAMTANALLDTELSESELLAALNRYLPDDIGVSDLKICADRFHSRYKAIGKTYRYSCWFGDTKPVFDRRYVTVLSGEPDLERMLEGAAYMEGMHDFKGFSSVGRGDKSTVRVVDEIRIEKKAPSLRLYFHGNGFLRNMVRILTGTLLEIGYGRMEPGQVQRVLESGDRSLAGPTAPAEGLMLMKVDY